MFLHFYLLIIGNDKCRSTVAFMHCVALNATTVAVLYLNIKAENNNIAAVPPTIFSVARNSLRKMRGVTFP